MESAPKELDWVTERAKCEINAAFEDLRIAVEKDVEQCKVQHGLSSVGFTSDPRWIFSVTRGQNSQRVAVFSSNSDFIEISIHVHGSSEETFKAVPVFTQDGNCKFTIEGEEGVCLFQWQLRRRALELVIFGKQRR